jgi:hypothetical protein
MKWGHPFDICGQKIELAEVIVSVPVERPHEAFEFFGPRLIAQLAVAHRHVKVAPDVIPGTELHAEDIK